jgi:hypothetical protein
MFSKKIILSVLTMSVLLVGKIQAMDSSDKLIGQITKKQGKDFCVGLGIGVTHGLANRVIEQHVPDKFPKKRVYGASSEQLGVYFVTRTVAAELVSTYIGDKKNKAVVWGHGIGQFLAESVSIDKNGKPELSIRLNVALICSLFFQTQ